MNAEPNSCNFKSFFELSFAQFKKCFHTSLLEPCVYSRETVGKTGFGHLKVNYW